MQKIFPLLAATLLLAGAAVHAEDEVKPRCEYVNIGELPIRFKGPGLQPTVEGSINDTPAVMLLDTGSSRTWLTRTGTDKRNLTLRSTGGMMAGGIGGMSAVYAVRLSQFGVGPASRAKTALGVLDEMGATPAFEAIVGEDFLLRSDLEISFADKFVKFHRPKDCKKAYLSYWDPGAMVIPFERSANERLNPELKVEINGVAMTAIIDTGAGTSTITSDAARRAGVSTTSPGVVKEGNFTGIGGARVGRWKATFDSFKIGDELVKNAAIDIRESLSSRSGPDVLLGADFIRAHRILIAMSQEKVYLSYLGGDVFGKPGEGIAPWIQREADSGNPDAQLTLAAMYGSGRGVARDAVKATEWLDKSAGQFHIPALLQKSRSLRAANKAADAVVRVRGGLEKHPNVPALAFELFLAQTQAGEREAAARDLAPYAVKPWPGPIASYLLGKIDAAKLMDEARDEDSQAQARSCEAGGYMADMHRVMGDPARAKQVLESVLAACRRRPE